MPFAALFPVNEDPNLVYVQSFFFKNGNCPQQASAGSDQVIENDNCLRSFPPAFDLLSNAVGFSSQARIDEGEIHLKA